MDTHEDLKLKLIRGRSSCLYCADR